MKFVDTDKMNKKCKKSSREKLEHNALMTYRKYCIAKGQQEEAGEAVKKLSLWSAGMDKLQARLNLIEANKAVESIEDALYVIESKLNPPTS